MNEVSNAVKRAQVQQNPCAINDHPEKVIVSQKNLSSNLPVNIIISSTTNTSYSPNASQQQTLVWYHMLQFDQWR